MDVVIQLAKMVGLLLIIPSSCVGLKAEREGERERERERESERERERK